ncbi:MAG: hypothetical protein WA843_03835 [Candidatus Saccharimonadales bacterium]
MQKRERVADSRQVADEQETAMYRDMDPGMFTSDTIVIQSAEGITGYAGADGDPTKATARWLEERYAEIREERESQRKVASPTGLQS